MILEPVTVLVLHCSRCNKPFTEYETAGAVYWPSRQVIESAFASSEYDGWVKLGDRYLCGNDCWRRTPDGGLVEAGVLSAIDEAVVIRERAGYADASALHAYIRHRKGCGTYWDQSCSCGLAEILASSPATVVSVAPGGRPASPQSAP